MNCRKFLQNLDDFVEGELPKGLESEMYEHMKTCRSCKAAFDEDTNAGKILNGIFHVSKEDYSSREDSIMNSLNKNRYKRRYKFKIASLIAAVVVAVFCIPYVVKLFNNSESLTYKTADKSSAAISDYFPLKGNVQKIYEGSGIEDSNVDTYIEYTDDSSIQVKSTGTDDSAAAVYTLRNNEIIKTVFNTGNFFRVNKLKDAEKSSNDNVNVILKTPIVKGNTWESKDSKFTITEDNIDIDTPCGKFKAVEVTNTKSQVSNAANSVNYYVKGIGLVKSVDTTPEGKIISQKVLKKINYDKPFELKYDIYYPQIVQGKTFGNPLKYTGSIEYKTNDDMNDTLSMLNNLLKNPPSEVKYNNGLPVLADNVKINSISTNGGITIDLNDYADKGDAFIENYKLQCIMKMADTLYSYNGTKGTNISFTINGKPYQSMLAGNKHFTPVEFKNSVSVNSESIYTLYSTDVNTGRQLSKEITIANSLSLNEKLNAIAAGLSQTCFKNLPIKVLRIEQTNGKKIAVVDLEESDVNKKKSDMADYVQPNWAAGYLQGSTGAEITSSSLINSFLQKNIKGTWIDGVQILYNGKTCDFEHAPALKDIIYR